ncbi:Thiolase-like protein [Venustampulla echinocandica]|uniref:Thiolase-like protein n=1 Tax=Venustampulla echinocandica TaxID=2656787 RepID=A0A370TNA4_9HELO|nr:Thiolase-like protein [Venustampulla echinocandica]RDL37010.1 Thiolase-like protein [Venustampulla echinocandica]
MLSSEDGEDAATSRFGSLNLSILGLGTEYPPYHLDPAALDTLVQRHYPESPAMTKIRTINKYTGIDTRSAIGSVDHPMANMDRAPNIDELCCLFLKDGVALAVTAARKALHEAQLSPLDITHVVSTTCTNSANPGFDHYVCKQLGMTQPVEKVLLHGIGCSGGLASLRTAANLALGSSFMGRRARVLVVALEISSLLVRSELDSIHQSQETRIGVALFSDCASAAVLSNGIDDGNMEPVYELLGWDHRIIPDTEEDLGFDVDPLGWKVVLSPRVPKLTAGVVSPTFNDLLSTLPDLPPQYREAADFDWALHPGGSTILSGVERAMAITPEHMRASYDTYINHGNSSSATILSVMDRLRQKDMDELAPAGKVKDFVVGCAFGPGIAIEMCMLKRNLRHVRRTLVITGGEATPPMTETDPSDESEGSRSDGEGDDLPQAEREVDGMTGEASELVCEKSNSEEKDSLAEALNGVELD